MKKFIPAILFSMALLFIRCGKEEGEDYVYTLPYEDRYVFNEGNLLLYRCSDGSSDTFHVEAVVYDRLVEEYPCGGLYGPDKTCTFTSDICRIDLRQLNGYWLTTIEGNRALGFPDKADTSNAYTLEFYGSFDSNMEASSCSNLGSGIEDHHGYIAGYCQVGLKGEEYEFMGIEYSNAYMKEGIYGENPGNPEIHFRIYWNQKYGIFRFENLLHDPVITWDLEGITH